MPRTVTKVRVSSEGGLTKKRKEPALAAIPISERVSSSDYVVQAIKRGLDNGHYAPGQELIEGELARQFNIGRGSVREAIKKLAAEGVVAAKLHQRARIKSLSTQDVLDLSDIAAMLIGFAARRAAERTLSVEEADDLRAQLGGFGRNKAEAQPPEGWRLHLYLTIAQLSGSEELERMILSIQATLLRMPSRVIFSAKADRRLAMGFTRVVDAILANDPAKAERAARQQFRRLSDLVRSMPENTRVF